MSAAPRTILRQMWQASPPLTAVGVLMLVVAAFSTAGITLDDRVITGVPAWLKPFKFAVSTGIYSLTLAWVFIALPQWRKVRGIVGWTTAVVFVLEVIVIDLQAARGTTSHFNIATRLDQVLFSLMGLGIFTQTFTSVAVAVALWRHRFVDRVLGWALRLGMTLTIVGAFVGPLMTRPTSQQLADMRAGGRITVVGAHTVGAPDGGAGLPLTGWSTEHGDLRVPHFIGLHAIQALALFALALAGWRRPEPTRVKAVIAATASYASLFALLLWQALRGESVVSPGAATLSALGAWAVLTLATSGAIALTSRTTANSVGRSLA